MVPVVSHRLSGNRPGEISLPTRYSVPRSGCSILRGFLPLLQRSVYPMKLSKNQSLFGAGESQMEDPGLVESMQSAEFSISPSAWPDERGGKQGIPGDGEDHSPIHARPQAEPDRMGGKRGSSERKSWM